MMPAMHDPEFDSHPSRRRWIYRSERDDGSGDLVFREEVTFGRKGRRHVERRGFLAVDDVRGVERLVRSTLKNG